MDENKKIHPSLPANYVTIIDLQKRWMKQQQQQQQDQEEEMKLKMEDNNKKNHPSLPANYVTIVDLQKQWMMKQQQQQEEMKREKGKSNPKKPLKVFRAVEKVSSSGTMASEINVAATKVDGEKMELIKREKEELDGEDVKKENEFQKIDRLKSDRNPNFKFGKNKFYGKNRLKMSNPMPETSEINGAFVKVKIDYGDADEKKNMKGRNGNGDMADDVQALKEEEKRWKGEMAADDHVFKTEDKQEKGKGKMAVDDIEADIQVNLVDMLVDIEAKLKGVSVNGRSKAVKEGSRRVDWKYKRVIRKGFGGRFWEIEREEGRSAGDGVNVNVNVNDQFSRIEKFMGAVNGGERRVNRWQYNRGEVNVNDQFSGSEKLMGAVNGGERRVNRWKYNRGEVNVNDQFSGSEESMGAVNRGERRVNRWRYKRGEVNVNVNDQFSGGETSSMAALNGGGRPVTRWHRNRVSGRGEHWLLGTKRAGGGGRGGGYGGRRMTEGGGGLMWVKKCEVTE